MDGDADPSSPAPELLIHDASRKSGLDTLPPVTNTHSEAVKRNAPRGGRRKGVGPPHAQVTRGLGPLPGGPSPALTPRASPAAAGTRSLQSCAHTALGDRPAPPGIGKPKGVGSLSSSLAHPQGGQGRRSEDRETAATTPPLRPQSRPQLTLPGLAAASTTWGDCACAPVWRPAEVGPRAPASSLAREGSRRRARGRGARGGVEGRGRLAWRLRSACPQSPESPW